MEVVYQNEYVKIKNSKVQNCLEITCVRGFNEVELFNLTIQKIKDLIINAEASKIIYILDKIDSITDIKVLEEDFYPSIVKHGVKKIAIVTGKELGSRAYHFRLYGTLRPLVDKLGLDSKLFFDLDNARIWITTRE